MWINCEKFSRIIEIDIDKSREGFSRIYACSKCYMHGILKRRPTSCHSMEQEPPIACDAEDVRYLDNTQEQLYSSHFFNIHPLWLCGNPTNQGDTFSDRKNILVGLNIDSFISYQQWAGKPMRFMGGMKANMREINKLKYNTIRRDYSR